MAGLWHLITHTLIYCNFIHHDKIFITRDTKCLCCRSSFWLHPLLACRIDFCYEAAQAHRGVRAEEGQQEQSKFHSLPSSERHQPTRSVSEAWLLACTWPVQTAKKSSTQVRRVTQSLIKNPIKLIYKGNSKNVLIKSNKEIPIAESIKNKKSKRVCHWCSDTEKYSHSWEIRHKKWAMRPADQGSNWALASMMRIELGIKNSSLNKYNRCLCFIFCYCEMSKPNGGFPNSHSTTDQRQKLEYTQCRVEDSSYENPS